MSYMFNIFKAVLQNRIEQKCKYTENSYGRLTNWIFLDRCTTFFRPQSFKYRSNFVQLLFYLTEDGKKNNVRHFNSIFVQLTQPLENIEQYSAKIRLQEQESDIFRTMSEKFLAVITWSGNCAISERQSVFSTCIKRMCVISSDFYCKPLINFLVSSYW